MRKKTNKDEQKMQKVDENFTFIEQMKIFHTWFSKINAHCVPHIIYIFWVLESVWRVSQFWYHLRRHSENLLPFYFSYLYFDWHIWTMWTRYLSSMPQWICVFCTYSMGVRAMCIRWCGFVSVATPNPFFLISLPKPWQTIAKKCGT